MAETLNDINKNNKTLEAQAAHDTQEAYKNIKFSTELDPDLDPASPSFNATKYKEYLSKCDLSDIQHRLDTIMKQANDAAAAVAAEINGHGIIPQAIAEQAVTSLRELMSIVEWTRQGQNNILLPELQQLFSIMGGDGSAIDWRAISDGLRTGGEKIKALKPYLEKELPALQQVPGLKDLTVDDLAAFIGLDGETIADQIGGDPVPAEIRDAIQRAQAAAYKAGLPTSKAKRAEIVEYPLDKVNSTIWNLLQDEAGPQMRLALKAEKDGSKKPLNIYYSIDFEKLEETGLKITKKLMPFDKRVYIAISALYNAGNKIMTLTQIHYAMGNTKRPSDNQLEKINDSITKMRNANVLIDNAEEASAYNYPRFIKGEFYLLPIDRATAVVNGKLSDAAIHVLKEPPIMTFAKQRRQITTITVKVLQSPLSKTDGNLIIDDYLIERIAAAKKGNKPSKILYTTLYEKTGITTKNQRTRAPEKIKTYLDHYKSCGLISGYKMLKDGIQIEY